MKVFIIALTIIVLAASCTKPEPYKYPGEYPELYSIAINTLLNARGYIHSEIRFDPEISVIEEDMYGRVLFLYYEAKTISKYSLIIKQKSDSEYVYWYPDYCFISAPDDNFQSVDIEKLKKENDWENEISPDKCIRTEIVREKSEGPVDFQKLVQLYKQAQGEGAYNNVTANITFLTIDDCGRSIYLGCGKRLGYENDPDPSRKFQFIVMLFMPDGSYDKSKCLMEIPDLYCYQDALKDFKETNDWNKPLDS